MFFDSVIDAARSALRKRRSRQRAAAAASWPGTMADVLEWDAVESPPELKRQGEWQVRATLAITLGDARDGSRHYGLLYSVPMGQYEAKEFVRSGRKPASVPVRYNPVDPDEMLAAPQAGALPFELLF